MFEETLYQDAADGKPFVDVLKAQGILPGIKVDTGKLFCPVAQIIGCCQGRTLCLQGKRCLAADWWV